MSAPIQLKYRAFLPYALADLRWGKWLHGQLEGFRIDKDLAGRATPMGPVPKSLRPIFRDREDFSGGHTLADATIAANDHTREIELFLTNPSAEDVDVTVRNVTLTELTAPPYRAAIDFEKSYYSHGTRQERKHETYVAQVQFALRDEVPNAFIRVNPLGMQITNFRVDQAFDR